MIFGHGRNTAASGMISGLGLTKNPIKANPRYTMIAIDVSESTANRQERTSQIKALFKVVSEVKYSRGVADIWTFHRKPMRIFGPSEKLKSNVINTMVRQELRVEDSIGRRGTYFSPLFDAVSKDPKVRQFASRNSFNLILLTDGGIDDPTAKVRPAVAQVLKAYPQIRLLIVGIENEMRERWNEIMPSAMASQIDFATHAEAEQTIRKVFED